MNKMFFLLIVLLLAIIPVCGSDLNLSICTVDTNDCDLNTNTDLNNYSFDLNLNANEGIPFYFFYSPGCSHCKNVEDYLQTISKDYNMNIKAINIKESQENLTIFTTILESFEDNDFGVPVLVINNKIYHGDKEIISNLKTELDAYKEKSYDFYLIKKKPKAVNLITVTGLALADSINPCELVVLLILLSSILMKFQSKRKMLEYGLAFIVTIYIIYLLMGLALIFGFKVFGGYVNINIIYTVLGSIALILGALNLKDAISYGAGNFVMEVPRAWRPSMKKILQSVTSVWSSVIVAVILAVFLLPCTAGPYVLVSGLLYNYSWLTVLLWLIYYNIIFSLPMWLILFAVYFGISKIEDLQRWRDRSIKTLHLVASILLILLGLYLFWIVFF
ncbi:MAG: hypothetical protein COT14_02930 [Candidatus Diapherotrites archaeon CG08_land_8_20_14_0_20_30_16]|nr:MAG: hypothetical protein COT14_02930 [Candidatus Diapherotrites archaeon CG08_land_8_20_14_0_20_30_16]